MKGLAASTAAPHTPDPRQSLQPRILKNIYDLGAAILRSYNQGVMTTDWQAEHLSLIPTRADDFSTSNRKALKLHGYDPA